MSGKFGVRRGARARDVSGFSHFFAFVGFWV